MVQRDRTVGTARERFAVEGDCRLRVAETLADERELLQRVGAVEVGRRVVAIAVDRNREETAGGFRLSVRDARQKERGIGIASLFERPLEAGPGLACSVLRELSEAQIDPVPRGPANAVDAGVGNAPVRLGNKETQPAVRVDHDVGAGDAPARGLDRRSHRGIDSPAKPDTRAAPEQPDLLARRPARRAAADRGARVGTAPFQRQTKCVDAHPELHAVGVDFAERRPPRSRGVVEHLVGPQAENPVASGVLDRKIAPLSVTVRRAPFDHRRARLPGDLRRAIRRTHRDDDRLVDDALRAG